MQTALQARFFPRRCPQSSVSHPRNCQFDTDEAHSDSRAAIAPFQTPGIPPIFLRNWPVGSNITASGTTHVG